jgi:hypothetical protein
VRAEDSFVPTAMSLPIYGNGIFTVVDFQEGGRNKGRSWRAVRRTVTRDRKVTNGGVNLSVCGLYSGASMVVTFSTRKCI